MLLPISNEFADTLWLTALSSPGLTAYCAMDLFARPMPGQTLVVTSAAGAVGSYAVQLGKLAGMHVVGIAGGEKKCRLVTEELGADACVDYRAGDVGERLGGTLPEDGVHLFFRHRGWPHRRQRVRQPRKVRSCAGCRPNAVQQQRTS